MATIFDVNTNELIEQAANELKNVKEIQPPAWSTFCKTGAHKERPPLKPDWWFARTASLLRKIYDKGPIGVSKLRSYYGGKKNNGMAPESYCKGSGNIIRKSLQQLESAGFVKKEEKSFKKGRIITPKGRKFLDNIAGKILKNG